ncbi:MAG TPA: hypothetical protein VK699_18030 [Terriglobales bacterium]|jgi:hypothetical protein|nr:hypothetical protein [Terriglobales bacterium]
MRKICYILLTFAVCWFAAYVAHAQTRDLKIPDQVSAGKGFTIPTSGSGDATFYLVGPGGASKRAIHLGDEVKVAPEETRTAGRYIAVLRAGGENTSKTFFVTPDKPAALNFLARPSRVPADKQDAISGVAFVFDGYKNLVLAPAPVNFSLSLDQSAPAVRSVPTKDGIAWTQMNSGRSQGAAQFVAGLPATDVAVRRVVQQVAGDACDLHMKAQNTGKAIVVETDPIRDCAGNAVPDGTIVTFTEVDNHGRSTVDARVKRDIARAELPLSEDATISAATGVVLGNEVHIGNGAAGGER